MNKLGVFPKQRRRRMKERLFLDVEGKAN